MAESIERYFQLLPVGKRRRPVTGQLWNPAADVYRTLDGWLVKVDLAGVSADDLEIEIAGPLLHLTGCRRDTFYGEGISCQQLEIIYSRFEKTLRFPCSIEGASLVRDYRDGLLIIYLRSVDNCKERDEG